MSDIQIPQPHLCKVRMQPQAEGTKLNMLQSLGENLIGGSVGFRIWRDLVDQTPGTWMVPLFIAGEWDVYSPKYIQLW